MSEIVNSCVFCCLLYEYVEFSLEFLVQQNILMLYDVSSTREHLFYYISKSFSIINPAHSFFFLVCTFSG